MPPLRRTGFFHFGGDEKTDPVGSLEIEIGKWPDAELKGSLIVLPESFNARKGYYWAPPDLDCHAMPRLQVISARWDIVFVAGLIESVKGPNSACREAWLRQAAYPSVTRKDYLESISTVPLLIIDDFGMRKLPLTAAEDPLSIFRAVWRTKTAADS